MDKKLFETLLPAESADGLGGTNGAMTGTTGNWQSCQFPSHFTLYENGRPCPN